MVEVLMENKLMSRQKRAEKMQLVVKEIKKNWIGGMDNLTN